MKILKGIIENRCIYFGFFLVISVCIIICQERIKSNSVDIDEFGDFSGSWKVSKYIGISVPFHEENDSKNIQEEKINEEIIDDYLYQKVVISKHNIEYFYPPSEFGHYYSTWSDIFMIYRVPHDIKMSPPFTCAKLKTKNMKEEVDIIIDCNEKAILYIRGVFFEMERILSSNTLI